MTNKLPLSLTDFRSHNVTEDLLTTVFQKLRGIKTKKDTLNVGVQIIHQALRCDRVVVYGLQADAYCKILAEAVTPGFAEILGTTIRDSCFEKGYIEKYRKGRVQANDNIYESEINACHIKNLEKIDVKANLVVPLREDNLLYGLLVLHQCSSVRKWQQSEVKFVLQVASWIVEQLLRQQNQTKIVARWKNERKANESITAIAQQIHGALTIKEVLHEGVGRAKEVLNCDRVIVYGLQKGNIGEIVAEATAPALASILGNVIVDPCFEYRYRDRYQQGRIRSIPNIYQAGMSDCYQENLAKIGVKSNLVAPINLDEGNIYGLLVAHQCFGFKDWQPEEIEHFKQIAFHTGLSLSKAKIKEQSLSIEAQIARLQEIKPSLNLAKAEINQIEQPLDCTSEILVEVNNLNRLLKRELDRIEDSGSIQTKKDTKMIQIIAKKLITVTPKLKSSLNSADLSRDRLATSLNKAISCIDRELSDRR